MTWGIAYRVGLTTLNSTELLLLDIKPMFQIAKDCEHTSASFYIGCIYDGFYEHPHRIERSYEYYRRVNDGLRDENYINATLSTNKNIESLAYFKLSEINNIKKDYDTAAFYYIKAIDCGNTNGMKKLTKDDY